MKNLFRILFVLGLFGLCLGIVVSYAGTKPFVRTGQEEEAAEIIARVKEAAALINDPDARLPQAVCKDPVHDFGLMDPLTVGSHTFYIENQGMESLVIQGGESSCKCTLSDLREEVIPPSGRHPVTLTWNSGHAQRSFEQLAIVRTNDPSNQEIRLSIKGQVRAVLAALTNSINLERLIPEKGKTAQVVLYSQVWNDIEIDRIESTNQHISASVTNEAYSGSFARGDEIEQATSTAVIQLEYDGKADRGPLSGRLRVYVRPPENWGQSVADPPPQAEPLNQAAQELDSKPNSESIPTLDDGTVLCELPFYGNVVRRVSLYGRVVNGDGEVNLGKLRPSDTKGSRWVITGRIRGELQPSEVQVEAEGIPGLIAEVEQFEANKAKNSFRVSLELTESLSPAIYNREQAGKLTIKTPGMPAGDESLEMPVSLTVINYQ